MGLLASLLGRSRNFTARVLARYNATLPKVKYLSFIPVHYKRIMAFQPDVIFTHDLSSLPLGAAIAKETGCRLVFDSHELESHRNPPLNWLQRRQVRSVERELLPLCDYVTTVCPSIADVLSADYGIEDVGLIYNAPYLHHGSSHPRWERRSGMDIRWDAGAKPDEFLLVYVGLITMNRGIEFALRAIEHLPANIRLVALGPGSDQMKDALRNYAKSLSLSGRFTILDPVNPHEVYTYIAGADATIIPIMPVTLSYEVALPNKFFEGGFSGLPIICADLTEMRKLMSEYRLGVTYDALDEDACADAILKVYNDREAYRPDPADVARFKRRFGWEYQEDVVVGIAERLIGPAQTALPSKEHGTYGSPWRMK